jgi:hypothetical protein
MFKIYVRCCEKQVLSALALVWLKGGWRIFLVREWFQIFHFLSAVCRLDSANAWGVAASGLHLATGVDGACM